MRNSRRKLRYAVGKEQYCYIRPAHGWFIVALSRSVDLIMRGCKVLVLGSERGDFFAHNVAYTLRKMEFEVYSDPGLGSAAARAAVVRRADSVMGLVSKWWSQKHDRRSIELVMNLRPAIVIACTRTYEPETVATWRKLGAIALCWYGDAPANVPKGHITSGEYDAVFVKDERFATDLRNVLKLNAHFLPEACNPDWHTPRGYPTSGELTIAGTMYGYRNRVAELLIEDGFEVRCYGPAPSAWTPEAVRKSHTGIFLDHTNKGAVFESSLACLNTFAPAERDALNCRIFETCGSGGVLITENRASLGAYFELEREVLTFSSYSQLVEQVERVRLDTGFAQQLRWRASRRAHLDHSYSNRLGSMLAVMGL